MTIYTRWQNEVRVLGTAGEQFDKCWMKAPGRLLLVEIGDDKKTRYRWDFSLRATDGIAEIDRAIAAAPKIKLTDLELEYAFLEAE